jgi:hypothetical protein
MYQGLPDTSKDVIALVAIFNRVHAVASLMRRCTACSLMPHVTLHPFADWTLYCLLLNAWRRAVCAAVQG